MLRISVIYIYKNSEFQIALLLAKTGANLICWDIDKTANDELVQVLKEKGVKAWGFEVDVSDRLQVEEVAKKVKSRV